MRVGKRKIVVGGGRGCEMDGVGAGGRGWRGWGLLLRRRRRGGVLVEYPKRRRRRRRENWLRRGRGGRC